jgi:sec-independent protein translocase protein TatA
MFGMGPQELVVILVIGLLFFGKNLPSIAASLARSIRAFSNTLRGIEEAPVGPVEETSRPPQRISPAMPKFEETPATLAASGN